MVHVLLKPGLENFEHYTTSVCPGEGNGNPLQYFFASRIPWTEEPGGLQSVPGGHKELDATE